VTLDVGPAAAAAARLIDDIRTPCCCFAAFLLICYSLFSGWIVDSIFDMRTYRKFQLNLLLHYSCLSFWLVVDNASYSVSSTNPFRRNRLNTEPHPRLTQIMAGFISMMKALLDESQG